MGYLSVILVIIFHNMVEKRYSQPILCCPIRDTVSTLLPGLTLITTIFEIRNFWNCSRSLSFWAEGTCSGTRRRWRWYRRSERSWNHIARSLAHLWRATLWLQLWLYIEFSHHESRLEAQSQTWVGICPKSDVQFSGKFCLKTTLWVVTDNCLDHFVGKMLGKWIKTCWHFLNSTSVSAYTMRKL